MGVITTGQTFASGDQVTATKLNDIANGATFTSAADTTDNSTLTLSSSSKLKVKDAGITATQLATDAVITAKIQDGAVTAAKLAQAAINAIMPPGSVIPFAGLTTAGPPAGWLFCDGGPQFQTDQPALFAALGTTYGSTATTFNVPDLRGRVVAGRDDMGVFGTAGRLTAAGSGLNGTNLGAANGLTETHTLSIAELPAHDHNLPVDGVGALNIQSLTSTAGSDQGYDGSVDSASTGGGGAHNNVQPTMILNYIIKT